MARIFFVLSLLLTACGGDPAALDGAVPMGDAGPLPTAILDLGTGIDAFAAVMDTDLVALSRGNQGLQHVWVCLRTHDLRAASPDIHLSLARPTDGVVVSDPYNARLPFAERGTYKERVGMRLVVSYPLRVVDQDLVLRATVDGRNGQTANAEALVHVLWEEDLGGTAP